LGKLTTEHPFPDRFTESTSLNRFRKRGVYAFYWHFMKVFLKGDTVGDGDMYSTGADPVVQRSGELCDIALLGSDMSHPTDWTIGTGRGSQCRQIEQVTNPLWHNMYEPLRSTATPARRSPPPY
jgi:hypothetical protein